MSTAVQELLMSFDALSNADKQQVTVEILRRVGPLGEGDLSDAALTEIAEEMFRALDEEEAADASR